MTNPVLPKPKESDIQRAILELLAYRRIFAVRVNVGMVPTGAAGKSAWRKSTMKGMADIIGVLPGGRFLAIEVKAPGGKATAEQQEFLDAVNKAGGAAFVARSTREVEAYLRELA